MTVTRLVTTIVSTIAITCGAATAETAKKIPFEEAVSKGRICYYETPSGFTYHYLVPKGLVGTAKCVMTLETPFAPPPYGYAVLLKDEVEMHDPRNRICYYGLRGRVFLRTIVNADNWACTFAVHDDTHEAVMVPTRATLVREERLTGTDSKICFYTTIANDPRKTPTHFVMRSIFGVSCPEEILAK